MRHSAKFPQCSILDIVQQNTENRRESHFHILNLFQPIESGTLHVEDVETVFNVYCRVYTRVEPN
jgi:hypothetical protein